MIRTYPLGTTGPRQPANLRDIFRRLEQEIASDPNRASRRQPVLPTPRRVAF